MKTCCHWCGSEGVDRHNLVKKMLGAENNCQTYLDNIAEGWSPCGWCLRIGRIGVLGVGAPKSKVGALTRQGRSPKGWSLTKDQVGAWQQVGAWGIEDRVFIKGWSPIYCTWFIIKIINKSIYSYCSFFCVLNIHDLIGKNNNLKEILIHPPPPLSISNNWYQIQYLHSKPNSLKFDL